MIEAKIPKKLHWIWFGPMEIPDEEKRCMESWHKVCPDYEIVKWNEDNFDVNASPYAKAAYEAKMFAYVSDYARFKICGEHGGIYLDTDMEFLKPLDMFLENDAFMSFKQYWHIFGLTSGVFGCAKNASFAQEIMDICDKTGFVKNQDDLYLTVSHVMIEVVKKRGIVMENKFQTGNGITVYPYEYLCPKVLHTEDEHPEFEVTENTHAIHHFCNSWLTPEMREKFWDSERRKQKEDPSRVERFKKETGGTLEERKGK